MLSDLLKRIFTQDCFQFMKQLPDNSIDLIISDGPYAVTRHQWDKVHNIQLYNLELIKSTARILKPGGSLYLFGKPSCIDFIDYTPYLNLNSKIIWYQPSRLAQGRKSYTNNYDIIAYFSKNKPSCFNLEDIRVSQLVELAHRKRCENVPSVKNGQYGKTMFNPKGKNPGDVWGDIKQLTYHSKELVNREVLNTIQKPEKLLKRIILASSNKDDIIFDPFVGVGTSLKVASELGRHSFGCEIEPKYVKMSIERLKDYGFKSGPKKNDDKVRNIEL